MRRVLLSTKLHIPSQYSRTDKSVRSQFRYRYTIIINITAFNTIKPRIIRISAHRSDLRLIPLSS